MIPPIKISTVLIVDDDEVDREAIRRHLKRARPADDLEIIEASTGGEALRLLKEQSFDCVFLDCLLPDMNGLAVLEALYNPETDLAGSAYILLTGKGSESVMLKALRVGAQDYLVKSNLSPDSINIAMIKSHEIFVLKQDRNRAEMELNHTRRIEAVGQLASGIAHDFNNLLTVVLGNTRLLRRRIQDNPNSFSLEEADKKIHSIEVVAYKGADLIKRLMMFSRQSPLSQETTDLNGCINEMSEILKRTLGEKIEIETDLSKELWKVSIDVREFEHALINLSVNARDAMPSGGKLTIKTENFSAQKHKSLREGALEPGNYVLVAVSDNGDGMSESVQKRIFEPFYTTKLAGQGTGLGLSMVYGFIKQSQGHIFVDSHVGQGSVFNIYLPCIKDDMDLN